MIIKTLKLDKDHWSSDWIPISYSLPKNKYNKSRTFLWSDNYEVLGIARSYYISDKHVQIGDIWLNEKYRGKYTNSGVKYSLSFLRKVISKIWKIYPNLNKISLIVAKDNFPAIKLYDKLNFKPIKNINSKMLHIKNGLYMERNKKNSTN